MLADAALNVPFFIGDQGFGNDFPAVALGSRFEGRAAEVIVESFGGTIGDGEDTRVDLHGGFGEGVAVAVAYFLVLETRVMAVMVMVLSTALHMS